MLPARRVPAQDRIAAADAAIITVAAGPGGLPSTGGRAATGRTGASAMCVEVG
jgi:hypothetical protein